ncbi:phenylalanine--tRNA ligase subunit beta [Candidatus Methylomirabilis sp.]|uniref:phenylalanine--tRNA ligase subunit beta n=1 Tax=Candidatus Methylomirabilis sp. TaxID=2032687 RepID=UPI002A63455B|nr:phenylalanine--tRNA ligase subunit beta [Candidatus Methylomirabilis sp.]
MKVSLEWLAEYVDVALPAKELAHRLTMSGTEVGGIEERGNGWPGIIVAQIESIGPHPAADSLTLVGLGLRGETITVVSGATNLKVGDRVPFAPVGARLIDAQTGRPAAVGVAQIHGVTSRGVLCSERELGLSEAHEGVLILPSEAEVGLPLNTVLGDTILDLEVTPNRPDCLGMLGVAREVAAITEEPLNLPDLTYRETGSDINDDVQVEILAPDLCPRYSASVVHGVTVGPSPSWIQKRLMAADVRPINNIVDITNYVMLEYGQPLHAFDYETIQGRRIVVRRAAPGESFRTLDGTLRTLTPEMLVIADAKRPVALAGIMGGSETEVTELTKSVLLESANFSSGSIRQSCRALRLRTEASLRFDKGLPSANTIIALQRATKLLVEICGGKASRGLQDLFPAPREAVEFRLTPAELRRVLGIELTVTQIRDVLGGRLGFDCREDGDAILVRPPAHRSDIQILADLVEEVARLVGYDRIPTTTLAGHLPDHPPQPMRGLVERLSDVLVGAGLQEVMTYSLVGRQLLSKMVPTSDAGTPDGLRLANPMTPDQEILRMSLLPSLLECLASNLRQDEAGPCLFEIGQVYLPRHADLPQERQMLVIGMAGSRWQRQWNRATAQIDFYDLKGVVELLLDRLNLGETRFIQITDQRPFHPGRTTAVCSMGERLGVMGELHPTVARNCEIRVPVYLAEFDLEQLLSMAGEEFLRIEPPPRFPVVRRDLALVVPECVPVAELFEAIRQAGGPLLKQVELFDLFRGEELPPGQKSCGIGLVFRSPDHTLTDVEVAQVEACIVQQLQRQTGARLRG